MQGRAGQLGQILQGFDSGAGVVEAVFAAGHELGGHVANSGQLDDGAGRAAGHDAGSASRENLDEGATVLAFGGMRDGHLS